MVEWLEQLTSSHRVQLGLVAIASVIATSSVIFTYQTTRRDHETEELKSSIPPISADHTVEELNEYGMAVERHGPHAADLDKAAKEDRRSAILAQRARNGDYDDDLILEQLARNRVFLTDDGLARLRKAFIIIVGCGGVGSHAIASLARSGVSKIRIIDFDQVTLSSLNRHAVATLADVGTPKVHCMRKRLEQVTPWTHFDCRIELFGQASAQKQLEPWDGQNPDYVIDAIDNIDSKVELLYYCHQQKLRVVSSMGAGCKSDPTRVLIGDISASSEDPLSRSTRRRLRALGVSEGIPVAFSTEKSLPGKAQLLPLPEEEYSKGSVGDLSVLPSFRVRILPVLGTMPAIFGMTIANHVMLEVSGYPHDYLVAKGRHKMYDAILANLQGQEEKLARWAGEDAVGLRLPITQDDVGYVVEEVFRGKSVVSGLTTRLALTRWTWNRSQEPLIDHTIPGQKRSTIMLGSLVLMTKEEAARHIEEILKGGKPLSALYSQTTLDLVARRMEEESAFAQYR